MKRLLISVTAAVFCVAAYAANGKFNPDAVSIFFGTLTSDGTYHYQDFDSDWKQDNQDVADKFLSAPENSEPICLRNDFVIRSINYPDSWGKMQFLIDGENQEFTLPCEGNDIYVRFPADGSTHTLRFAWPDMGAEAYKEYRFTDKMNTVGHLYHLKFTRHGDGDINAIECSFTADGDETSRITRRFTPMAGDKWSNGDLETAYRLARFDEPVDHMFFYDGVEEGAEHQAFRAMECDIAPVTATLLQSGKPQVSAAVPAGKNYQPADARIYTVNSLYAVFYCVDAPEGKHYIKSGVSLNGKPLEGLESDLDPEHYFWSIPVGLGETDAMLFSIDGCMPVMVDTLKFSGRKIIIDGEERKLYNTDYHHILIETTEMTDKPVQLVYVEMDHAIGDQPEQWQRYTISPEVIDFGSKDDLTKLRLAVFLKSVKDPSAMSFAVVNRSDNTRRAEAELTSWQPYLDGAICRLEVALTPSLAPAGNNTEVTLNVDGVGDMHLCHLSNSGATIEELKNTELGYDTPQISLEDADTSDFGHFSPAVNNFKIETPTAWPVAFGIRHDENGYYLKGILRYNFMDWKNVKQMLTYTKDLDKHWGYLENTFHDICEGITNEKARHRYTPDERLTDKFKQTMLVQGYVEGRFFNNSGSWKPEFSSAGFSFTAGMESIFRFHKFLFDLGVCVGANVTLGADIRNNFLPTGEKNMILGTEFSTALWINASATLGLNIFVAKLVAGIRGGAELGFKGRAEKNLTTDEKKKGLNLTGSAWFEAFAEARFLWWDKKKTFLMCETPELNKLYPDMPFNPYFKGETPKSAPSLMPAAAPEITYTNRLHQRRGPGPMHKLKGNFTTLVDNVDSYASAHWLFGTDDLYYTHFDNAKFNGTHLKFLSGGSLFGASMYGVKSLHDIDMASSPDGKFAVATAVQLQGVPMSYLKLDPNDPANAGKVTEVYNKGAVAFAVNDGKSWKEINMDDIIGLTNATISPQACIDFNYEKAQWPETFPKTYPVQAYGAAKIGKSISSPLDDDPMAHVMDGDLKLFSIYLNTFDKEYVARPIGALAFRHDGLDIADYSIGANRGRLAVAAACIRPSDENSLPALGLSLVNPNLGQSANRTLAVYDDINLAKPTLLAGKDKGFYIAGMDGSDISIYHVDFSGVWVGMKADSRPAVRKVCDLGLRGRGVSDYRVVVHPQADSESLDGYGIIWREAGCRTSDSSEAVVKTSLYGVRINVDDSGMVYISTPMPVLQHEDGKDDTIQIMDFDGAFREGKLAVVATVADRETATAKIIKVETALEDGIKLQHSGLYDCSDGAKDPILFFEVMNQGVDPVSQLEINVNGKTTVKQVNLMPATSITVTAAGPWNITDPSLFVYRITPSFVADLADASPRKAARVRRALRARVSEKDLSGSLDLDISDIRLDALRWKCADNGDITVPVVVYNMTDVAISDDLTVKVGIYTDPAGHNLASPSAIAEISAASLFDKARRRNVTRLLNVTAPSAGHSMLYAVAQTVDKDGNVVHDHHPDDNCVPLRLEPSSSGSSADMVADNGGAASFTVTHRGAEFRVTGLRPGTSLRVYESTGALVKWIDVKDENPIDLTLWPGCFLFTDGTASVKALY